MSGGGPIVSVAITTRNRSALVRDALDGVLKQVAQFPIQIVVGDDASSDDTLEVLERYKRDSPSEIVVLRHQQHVGVTANTADVLAACSGKYIALLDSDDYWTESHKLRVQAEYLDRHSEISACFHNAWRAGDTRTLYNESCAGVWSAEDLIVNNVIPPSTLMLRNPGRALPPLFRAMTLQDWALNLVCASSAPIGGIDEVLSVYRIHAGSWFSSLAPEDAWSIRSRDLEVIGRFYPRYRKAVRRAQSMSASIIAGELERRGARSGGWRMRALRFQPWKLRLWWNAFVPKRIRSS